jgi:hypothetical protein
VIAPILLRKAMHDIARKKGAFTLFALFMRADALGNWDLVVSAPWLGPGTLKATRELVELLAKSLGEDALPNFARVATLSAQEPSLKFILENFPVDDGELRVRGMDLFGLRIEEGIIFRAKPPDNQNGARGKPLQAVASAASRRRG